MAMEDCTWDSGARYIPFYDPDDDDIHVQWIQPYNRDDYRGFPLSETGYQTETAMHNALRGAMQDGKLPAEVAQAYKQYMRDDGVAYRGILD